MRINSINEKLFKSPQKQCPINFEQKSAKMVSNIAKQVFIPTAVALAMMVPSSCATMRHDSQRNKAETNLPYYIQPESVQYSKDFKMDGKKYTMYYTDYCQKFSEREDAVLNIYFVPEDFKLHKNGAEELNSPPVLEQFVYHEIDGGKKDFTSAIISESTCNADGSDYKHTVKQIVLPDEIGEKLLDLYHGKTKFYLVPGVDTYLQVFSDKLMEPKIQEGKIPAKLD